MAVELTAHSLNLATHIGAGAIGLGVGFYQIFREKGGAGHRRRGMWFVTATMVVTGTAAIGNVFFRFMPLFAVLAVLVTYQTVSGIRVVRRRAQGPGRFDLAWSFAGLGAALALVPALLSTPAGGGSNPTVMWSSLGALGALLAYDFARFAFPPRWHARVWEYEHIYKLVASLFGMLSALVGNVVRWGQPWSQVLPSVLGTVVIVVLMINRARKAESAA